MPDLVAAASAGCFSVWIAQLRRDAASIEQRTGPLVALCERQGFAFWLGSAITADGWVVAILGDPGGPARIEAGLRWFRSIGSEYLVPMGTNALSEALLRAGRCEEALEVAEDTASLIARNGDRFLKAETLRLCGEAKLAMGATEAATKLFAEAAAIAREQGADLWELRALRHLRDGVGGRGGAAELRIAELEMRHSPS